MSGGVGLIVPAASQSAPSGLPGGHDHAGAALTGAAAGMIWAEGHGGGRGGEGRGALDSIGTILLQFYCD
jgi:hypothetical protein